MPALHLAEAADRGDARVWLYERCWGFGPRGASYGLDTLLLFGTADVDGEVTTAGPAAGATSEQLSHVIRTEHLAFATTGKPGWTRFRTSELATRVDRPEPVLVAYPEERSRALWRHQRFGVLDGNSLGRRPQEHRRCPPASAQTCRHSDLGRYGDTSAAHACEPSVNGP